MLCPSCMKVYTCSKPTCCTTRGLCPRARPPEAAPDQIQHSHQDSSRVCCPHQGPVGQLLQHVSMLRLFDATQSKLLFNYVTN